MKPQEAKVLYGKGEFLIFSILPEADPPPKAGRAPLAEKEGKLVAVPLSGTG